MKTAAITAGVRGETDFLRRQNNRYVQKQKKLKSIRLTGLHLILILATVSAIAFFIYRAGHFVLNWEQLNIQSVKLYDIPDGKEKEVKNILTRFGGNILRLDVEGLRAELMSIPEVEDVAVSRVMPSSLEVTFILRKPAFQLEINGKYNIMDKEGVTLYRGVPGNNRLITVRHMKSGWMSSIVEYYARLDEIRDSIEYISWRHPYGILLKLKNIPETFYPGEIDFAGKINYYLKFRNKLPLNIAAIKNVDLRFEDRFYLEFYEEVSTSHEE